MDFVFLRFRFDGLLGRFPRGKMCFGKCIFFTSLSLFYNISNPFKGQRPFKMILEACYRQFKGLMRPFKSPLKGILDVLRSMLSDRAFCFFLTAVICQRPTHGGGGSLVSFGQKLNLKIKVVGRVTEECWKLAGKNEVSFGRVSQTG
jgi:hypothetical protein